jgi:hypothetical protein
MILHSTYVFATLFSLSDQNLLEAGAIHLALPYTIMNSRTKWILLELLWGKGKNFGDTASKAIAEPHLAAWKHSLDT